MKRTTIFTDQDTLHELKRIAYEQGQPVSAVIREALAQYVSTRRPAARRFSFTWIGDSGLGDLARNADKYLAEIYEERHAARKRADKR